MEGRIEELTKRLGQVSHFQDLPPRDLLDIVQAGQVRRFQSSEMIFLQDDPCAGMFVLLSGQVHLCRLGPSGQQHILVVVNPVIMFNEVAVLDGGPNPVTAIAAQDCLLWQIEQPAFARLLKRHPEIGLGLLRVLAARNRVLISQYEDLSFRTVLSRTAKLLLELSDNAAKPITRRDHSIEMLASRLATVREAVSRSLNYLKRRGLISLTRAAITIQDPSALAALAQIDPYTLRE